jgi:hypothetical protein
MIGTGVIDGSGDEWVIRGWVPALTPSFPARMRPSFLRMKLPPTKALEATASARPTVLSDDPIPSRPPGEQ